jgi:hypothetical protein
MPGMILEMRTIDRGPQDADESHEFIETGPMGACVSVIVGWNPNDAREMTNMRGFHGAGGIDNVNFRALFLTAPEVPNNENTKVWMISGADNTTRFGIEGNRARILQEVRTNAGLGRVLEIRSIHGVRNARVFRNGNVVRL